MAVEESSDNEFDVFQERDNSSLDSEAEDGAGGDDMASWEDDRVDKLRSLIKTTYNNDSEYTIEHGVVDSVPRSFDKRWYDQERDNVEPEQEAQDGAGGDDMAAWDDDRVERIRNLITTTYNDESSYDISHAVVDMEARSFDTRWFDQERDNVEADEEAQDGDGGEDMESWDADRVERIRNLVTTTYNDESAYSISHAVVDMEARTFDTRWFDQEKDNVEPEGEAEDGESDEIMSVWTALRAEKFNTLIVTDFENESEFELGNGVADSNVRTFDTRWDDGENGNGISVEGTATDDNGEPLGGDSMIVSDGTIIGDEFTSGSISVTAPPPTGVFVGEDSESSTVDFRFTPSIDGIDYIEEDIGLNPDTITVEYGRIEGTVTDVDDNPVSDVQIQGSGAATNSDRDGEYQFLAPAGTEFELLSLERSHTKEIEISPEQTEEVDWQFPGIRIRVRDPALEPIENAPVFIGDTSYRTDQNGEVRISEALMTEYPIVVMEYYTAELDIDEEGRLYRLSLGGDSADFNDPEEEEPVGELAGLRVKLRDAYDARTVREGDVRIPGTDLLTYTNADGKGVLVAPTGIEAGDKVPALLCGEDERYKSASYPIPLVEGESEDVEVDLERKTQTVNV